MKSIQFANIKVPLSAFPLFDITLEEANMLIDIDMLYAQGKRTSFLCWAIGDDRIHYSTKVKAGLRKKIERSLGSYASITSYLHTHKRFGDTEIDLSEESWVRRFWIALLLNRFYKGCGL